MRNETPWNPFGLQSGKTNFYCRFLNKCLKDTSLSACVNQIVLEAAFDSVGEGGGEIQWLPFKTGRHCLLYKLYLHNDRLFSYRSDLKIYSPISKAYAEF